MKIRIAAIAALIIVVAAGATYIYVHRGPQKGTFTAKPEAAKPQELNPIAVEAIRKRSYPGSELTVVQSLGAQGGYINEVVSYQSDGLKVRALRSTPTSAKPAAGWPVIILNHGYINPSEYRTEGPEYQQFIAAFTQAGYMVVKPDFRGHGQSEGAAEGGHFSPVYAYDELNLIASLKKDGQVDAKRIGLFGHSMGAHVTLRTIVISKDIKATVMMSGVVGSMDDLFYNWPHSPAPNDQPQPLTSSKRQSLVDTYGDPKKNPEFWKQASAINYLDAVTGPVLIHHSQQDSTVPILFSQHLASALKAAGRSGDLREYPGDDHQFTRNRIEVLNSTVAFYRANL